MPLGGGCESGRLCLDRDQLMCERRIAPKRAAREQVRLSRSTAKPDFRPLGAMQKNRFEDAVSERLRLQSDGLQLRRGQLLAQVDLRCLEAETIAGAPS